MLPIDKPDLPRGNVSRRDFVKTSAAAAALGSFGLHRQPSGESADRRPSPARAGSAVVVGAGAFGGWTALHLLRRGLKVTLVDSWGPGNARSSSGGDTRIIRATYGPNRVYVTLVARSLELWREHEQRWGRPLYVRTGSLRMKTRGEGFDRAAIPLLKDAGLVAEEWTLSQAAQRYPQINFEGVSWVFYEPEAGYIHARDACRLVVEGFVKEGGEYRQAVATPGDIESGALASVRLADGTSLTADQYVFACGPWLRELIPEVVGDLVRPTRQEVFYFGTPAGDSRFAEGNMPVWVDAGPRTFYGIPGNQGRGFKIADDTRGEPFDPTAGDRMPSHAALVSVRAELATRFPTLKDAPLLEARVCQYENAPDSSFILDHHPLAGNLWIVGGGSGHGFKHGPALGEMVARAVQGERAPETIFRLQRFAR